MSDALSVNDDVVVVDCFPSLIDNIEWNREKMKKRKLNYKFHSMCVSIKLTCQHIVSNEYRRYRLQMNEWKQTNRKKNNINRKLEIYGNKFKITDRHHHPIDEPMDSI